MKLFKVIYRYGHFIDASTQKRIIPIQGQEYTLTANDNAFKTEDDTLVLPIPQNRQQKELWANSKYSKGNYYKILDANAVLYFKIGNTKKTKEYKSYEYFFACRLLEDLYLFKKATGNDQKPEDWRLTDCLCLLDDCVEGQLIMSDKLPANSLSQLFGNTVMFYFNRQRSSSCNAFKTFFLSFDPNSNHLYNDLDELRQDFVAGLKK